jgi:hypothetical protein
LRVSHPGRHGDCLWAGPTMRALAETYGPLDLVLSAPYGRDDFLALWRAQPYIASAIRCDDWAIVENAPLTPWQAPIPCDVHLGYQGWPQAPTLAEETYRLALEQIPQSIPPLDLDSPWINVYQPVHENPYPPHQGPSVAVGFTYHHIELKAGVMAALLGRFPRVNFFIMHWPPAGTRWPEFASALKLQLVEADWLRTTQWIASCDVFLGDLSSQWVLANALGKPTVIVEPMPERTASPLFWRNSPRNHLVTGGYGTATHDSRATGDLLEQVLKEVSR